jgi:hypothetical protein
VLYSTRWHNDCIFIFNSLDRKFDEPNVDRAVVTKYCSLFVSADNMVFGMQGLDCIEVNTIKPATKIQRNLLFQKMKEAGCEWDAEKKQVIDYLDRLPKDNWELVHEFVEKFGRIPKDEDELNTLVEYVLKRQKPNWTKEDENKLNEILLDIECSRAIHLHSPKETFDSRKNWLKSIKHQNTWKPSDEQMNNK